MLPGAGASSFVNPNYYDGENGHHMIAAVREMQYEGDLHLWWDEQVVDGVTGMKSSSKFVTYEEALERGLPVGDGKDIFSLSRKKMFVMIFVIRTS